MATQLIDSFINKLNGGKCITYEICPDKSPTMMPLVEKIENASINSLDSKRSIDAFVCTDSPLAKLRMHAGFASIKIQNLLHKPTICTISMRDRNSLSLTAEILGLNDFDIRMFLALSGDPLKLGDQQQAKGVFEGNSLKILDIINAINSGVDSNNNALKAEAKRIYPFSVINSYAKNMNMLKNKMELKIRHGAIALFTQPIYDVEVSKMLHSWLSEFNAKYNSKCVIMQGFFPVTSYKRALFLYEKLPGVFIPDSWLSTLESASKKGSEYERKKGLEMSIELFGLVYSYSPKIHFMNHNAIKTAKKILESF